MISLARLRRFWRDVHLWIGAGLCLVLIPLSVTGSLLVWHDAIDHALYAERYAVSGPTASQPVEAYAAAAQKAFGEKATLTQVRLPLKPGDPVVAVGRIDGPVPEGGRPRTVNLWIDPPTGRVLAKAELANTATQVIHVLHGSLLIPDIGRKVVGWLGWAMFVSSATGLWLWWPRSGGFLKGLRWRRSPSLLFNLHNTVGFWICLPLAVLSLTGVYISFPQTSHALVGAPPPPSRPPGRNAAPLPAPRLGVADAVAIAAAKAAGAQVGSVSTPTVGREPSWQVDFKGLGVIRVVDATGEVRTGRGPGAGGPDRRDTISPLIRRLHDGGVMGLPWRLVITAAGLAPAVLGLSGVIMWLRSRARRRAIGQAVEA